MIAYRKLPKASRGDPWVPVSFHAERVVWRDSLALLESVAEGYARPRTMEWLSDLVAAGFLPRSSGLSLALLGLSTDQAKVLLWRHERMPLPLAYLDSKPLLDSLRTALGWAEDAADVLRGAVDLFLKAALAPGKEEKVDRKRVAQVRDSVAPERPYWAALEPDFMHLIAELPADRSGVDTGCMEYGTWVLPEWAATLRRAAMAAFGTALSGFGTAPRILRASAIAEGYFRRRLAGSLPRTYEAAVKEVSVVETE